MRGGYVLCGWLALGKKPYQGLLIGVTWQLLLVPRQVKLIRRYGEAGCDPRLFTGNVVYRHLATTGFIHWRIQLAKSLTEYNRVYHLHSHRTYSNARVWKAIYKNSDRCRENAWADCARQQRNPYPKSIYEGIQTINRNLVCMLDCKSMHTGPRAPAISYY